MPNPLQPSPFFRLATDRARREVDLEGAFAGPRASACWLIGGGPSLERLPVADIAASGVPTMAVNLAGTRLLRPTFWTAYDPTARFLKSIYLDAGVMKFLPRTRGMDLVPGTTFKVCDCPNAYFFERDAVRGYADAFSPTATGILDWRDTLVQAIDVLYRLGFRTIYLAGCEMAVRPSPAQIRRAADYGVNYVPRERLRDFVRRCEEAGLSAAALDDLSVARPYHFDEWKPLPAAAATDEHYFRIVQSLRLSRRALSLAGVQLVSVTPHSRLNDFFPYRPVRRVLREIAQTVGDLRSEPVTGLYRQAVSRHRDPLTPMRDFPAPARKTVEQKPNDAQPQVVQRQDADDPDLLVECEQLQRADVDRGNVEPPFLREEG